MKFVIQRVTHASVTVEGKTIGSIGNGLLVFVGVGNEDTKETADVMIKKMTNLRIFEDENGKTNRSLKDVNGSLLIISQFTLYADCRKGNRPSFTEAGNPTLAKELYNYIVAQCKTLGFPTEQGEFGADMKVELLNDGPFTICLP